jgi:hypothetical protein
LVKVPRAKSSRSPTHGRLAIHTRGLSKSKSANSTPTAQTLHMHGKEWTGETRRFELDEWVQGYRQSTGDGMKSVVLSCQAQLVKAEMFSAKFEDPNELKTAIACDCLEQMAKVMPQYECVMAPVRKILHEALFERAGEVRSALVEQAEESELGFLAEAPDVAFHGKIPYFDRCRELERDLYQMGVLVEQLQGHTAHLSSLHAKNQAQRNWLNAMDGALQVGSINRGSTADCNGRLSHLTTHHSRKKPLSHHSSPLQAKRDYDMAEKIGYTNGELGKMLSKHGHKGGGGYDPVGSIAGEYNKLDEDQKADALLKLMTEGRVLLIVINRGSAVLLKLMTEGTPTDTILIHYTLHHTHSLHPTPYSFTTPYTILIHYTMHYTHSLHHALYSFTTPYTILIHYTMHYTHSLHPALYYTHSLHSFTTPCTHRSPQSQPTHRHNLNPLTVPLSLSHDGRLHKLRHARTQRVSEGDAIAGTPPSRQQLHAPDAGENGGEGSGGGQYTHRLVRSITPYTHHFLYVSLHGADGPRPPPFPWGRDDTAANRTKGRLIARKVACAKVGLSGWIVVVEVACAKVGLSGWIVVVEVSYFCQISSHCSHSSHSSHCSHFAHSSNSYPEG